MTDITRKGLWELFVGTENIEELQCRCGKVYFSVRRPGTDSDSRATFHSIKLSDLDDIEKIFVGILRFLPLTNHLLLILWIREAKFEMTPLREKDMLSFVQRSLTISDIKLDDKTVMEGLDALSREGFLQNTISNDDPEYDSEDDCTMVYSFTAKGKSTVEKMFDNAKKVVSAYIESVSIASEEYIADSPRMTQAASGRGNPKSGMTAAEKAYQAPIEWQDEPANVNLNRIDPAEREALGEAIGRNTAKWLLKVKLSKTNRYLHEEILSDMGFHPVEVAEKLYPNVKKSERRKHSQRISKTKNRRNKTS